MFSIEHDELFQVTSVSFEQGKLQQSRPVITPPPCPENMKPRYSQKRKSSAAFMEIHDEQSPKDFKKRIAHRDVERQRRQEMASLYLSLRSLLPDKYLEGKGSTSDLMHGAVEYIRYLNQRLDELTNKKDKLQELLNLGSFIKASECLYGPENSSVMVNSSTSGMEVILRTTLRGGLPLSEFLDVLNREGMSITSCNSTKVNHRSLHVIEFEVDEGMNVDRTKLLEKLQDLVCNLL